MAASFSADQKKTLLLLIAVLVLARFFGMPWYDAQQSQRQSLQMTTQQLERAERLVRGETQTSGEIERLRQLRTDIEDSLLPYRSDSELRLTAQQRIEQVVQGTNTSLSVFEWVGQRAMVEGYLMAHQGRLVIEGTPVEVLRTQLALKEGIAGFSPQEMTLQPQRNATRMVMVFEVASLRQ